MKSRNTHRTANHFAICAAALLATLTACGKDSSNSSPPPSSLTDGIASLEANGTLPKLDRSTDVAGPDANGNGVRDDIEAWINTQPVTTDQKTALMQNARAFQHTLTVDLTDATALESSRNELMAAVHCGSSRFPAFADFYPYNQKIEAITANTRERAMRYIQYNVASSETSNTLPNYDTCEP